MRIGSRDLSNMTLRPMAALVLAMAGMALAGCATTRQYTQPNGQSAYEVKCSLWYQCTAQAKSLCPRGYRLVRGPLRPPAGVANGPLPTGPSRIDFACK